MLGPGRFLGLADNHVQAHEYLDAFGITSGRHRAGAHLVHLDLGRGLVLPADKHALGMSPGELQATLRTAGLEQHRRALRRRLAEVITLHLIELAGVLHLVHLLRLGVDPPGRIVEHRVVFPAAFPEFVEHLQVLVGLVVAPVMFDLLLEAHGPGGAVEITGDDVPADPPTAQMVERRHPPGKQVRRLVSEVGGQAEAEVFRHRRHRRNQQQRIVDRQLDRLPQRHLHRPLVHVVDPDDIGDKQTVEQTTLQQLRQLGPVFQRLVLGRVVPRMGPQAVVDMPDAVHVEGIEQDLFLRHQMVPRSGGFSALR